MTIVFHRQHDKNFVYILVAVIVAVNVFHLHLAIGSDLISFMVIRNNTKNLPANNQNLEKSTLRITAQVTLNNSRSFCSI